MRFVHISAFYYDGWGYQDNLLPEYQHDNGNDVFIISGNARLYNIKDKDAIETIVAKGNAYEINGVKIRKIKYLLNTSNASFLCGGLYKTLCEVQPDAIMHHGLITSTLIVASFYKRKHPKVKLYVDNHADWINCSHNKYWNKLYTKGYQRLVVKMTMKYVDMYFGVTPLRCEYLHKVHGIPENKISLLPIGCDTKRAQAIKYDRIEERKKIGIPEDAFVVVTGGKMDKSKGTLELIEVCKELRKEVPCLYLLMFGKADDDVLCEAQQHPFIITKGWCDRQETLTLLSISDVACWPKLHTTLIEDSIACGTPLIVKSSGNVRHFDKEGVGVFLQTGEKEELEAAVKTMITSKKEFDDHAAIAKKTFSYVSIADALSKGDYNRFKFYLDKSEVKRVSFP